MTAQINIGKNERIAGNDYVEVHGDVILNPYAPCAICQCKWVIPEVEVCNDCSYQIRQQHLKRARQTKMGVLLTGFAVSLYLNLFLFGVPSNSDSYNQIWKYIIYSCEVTLVLIAYYLAYIFYKDEPL